MKEKNTDQRVYPSAAEDAEVANSSQLASESYQLAYADKSFLLRDDLYPCYFKMLCQAQGRRPEQDAT